MEKDVAIREWCIDKALIFYGAANAIDPRYADSVIKLAKKIEKYVLSN